MLPRNKFNEILTQYIKNYKASETIDKLIHTHFSKDGVRDFFSFYSLLCINNSTIIDLLTYSVNDKLELINYWLFESFGKEIMVKDEKSGKKMYINNVDTLYNVLEYLNNKNYNSDYFITETENNSKISLSSGDN